jgi:hypothetical protein
MAGSIRQRKDRGIDTWELRVFIGRTDRGQPKQRSILFRGGKRAAERELARLVIKQESSPVAIAQDEGRSWGSSTTTNQAIEGWKENGWADLSPKTVRGYEEIWERYVRETIGAKCIAALFEGKAGTIGGRRDVGCVDSYPDVRVDDAVGYAKAVASPANRR